ncbi:sensor histidine kinase [soil metagenome]
MDDERRLRRPRVGFASSKRRNRFHLLAEAGDGCSGYIQNVEWLSRIRAAWRRLDRLWVDWIPVAVLLLLSQFDPNLADSDVGTVVSPVLAGAFTVATVLPLGWRRSYPLPMLGVIAGSVIAWGMTVGPIVTFTSFLSLILAIYSVAAYAELHKALVGIGVTAAAVTAQALTDRQPSVANDWIYPVFYFGGAWVLGRAARRRDERNQMLTELSLQLERERDQQGQLAAAEERTRIARELHDVIAHGVGIMVVQAEAAHEVLASSPEQAQRALEQIHVTGRQALGELRHLFGVLRHNTDDSQAGPQPSLADLPALVETLNEAGLAVTLAEQGEPRRLSAGFELSIYRIVQEALTNVRKHAQASQATVAIHYQEDQIEVEVTDNGTEEAAKSSMEGHGLIGMRERVASYGGTFRAGPVSGGYSVRAVLPAERAE